MNNPRVSICIPVYNGQRCIATTIQHVLNQTYSNFELIIVDDNSKDATKEAVLGFKDIRIKYYRNHKNLGMVQNWNKSISYATGEYIKLLCMDDLIEINCLELQVKALEENPSAVVVTSNTNIIDSNNNILMIRKNFKHESIIKGSYVSKRSLVVGQNLFGEPCAVLYRRDLLSKIGNYDKNFWYAPDWDFIIRALEEGDLFFVDKPLASFRLSSTSQTTKIITKNKLSVIKEDIKFMKKHTSKIKLNLTELSYHFFRTWGRLLLKSLYLRYILRSTLDERKEKQNALYVQKAHN